MDDKDSLKRRLQDLTDAIGDAAGDGSHTNNINVAGRVNKAINANIGEPGSAQGASSKQTVRISQNGEENYSRTETTQTTWGKEVE